MKLEFLTDVGDGAYSPHAYPKQLIRLYNFDFFEANLLRQYILTEIIEDQNVVDLSELDFIVPVNCNLRLCVTNGNEGIITLNNDHFACNLTIKGYEEMVYLMEPFCNTDIGGYQWLYEWGTMNSEIEFLFSPYGSW